MCLNLTTELTTNYSLKKSYTADFLVSWTDTLAFLFCVFS